MSFVFESGKHPYRYVYLGEAYRDMEGRPRNRRVRIGKVEPVYNLRLYYHDFLVCRVINGINIPPELQKSAKEAMDDIAVKFPKLLETFNQYNPIRNGLQRRVLTPLFSIQDIKDSVIVDFGAVHLCKKILESLEVMTHVEEVFEESFKDILNVGIFLATSSEPMDNFLQWAGKVDVFPISPKFDLVKDPVRQLKEERFLKFFRGYALAQDDSSTYNYVLDIREDSEKGLEEEPPLIDRHQFIVGATSGRPKLLYSPGRPAQGPSFTLLEEQSSSPKVIVERIYNLGTEDSLDKLLNRYQKAQFVCEIPQSSPFLQEILYRIQGMTQDAMSAKEKEPLEVTVTLRAKDGTPLYLFFEKEDRESPLKGQDKRTNEEGFRVLATNFKKDMSEAKRLLQVRSFLEEEYLKIYRRLKVIYQRQDYKKYLTGADFLLFIALTIKVYIYLVVSAKDSPLSSYTIEQIILSMEHLKKVTVKSVSFIQTLNSVHWDIYKSFGVSYEEIRLLESKVD
ncbi:MAG: hypothetical protein LBE38_07655 [Deltaproteobacteria bacterium]|jgi:hypothetical protein|nr:hypothetical protein [Deltaproteobacteria bacterium]